MDEPFGRQPQPVTVTIEGEWPDINYWLRQLSNRAEFKGDMVQSISVNSFKIYPRAVND